jgi:hypothetical protein
MKHSFEQSGRAAQVPAPPSGRFHALAAERAPSMPRKVRRGVRPAGLRNVPGHGIAIRNPVVIHCVVGRVLPHDRMRLFKHFVRLRFVHGRDQSRLAAVGV